MSLNACSLFGAQLESRTAMSKDEVERVIRKHFAVSKCLQELFFDSTSCVSFAHTSCNLLEQSSLMILEALVSQCHFFRLLDKEIELRENIVKLRL